MIIDQGFFVPGRALHYITIVDPGDTHTLTHTQGQLTGRGLFHDRSTQNGDKTITSR